MASTNPLEGSCVSLVTTKSTRGGYLPFEQLKNLPKPVIPKIDLDIRRSDVKAMLQLEPSISTQRRVGYFTEDRSVQTEGSQILDVKHAAIILQTLTQDIGQLRRDLNFAKHVLGANYETKIQERATELHGRVSEQLNDLEQQHLSKIETIRKSYQTKLDNAIQVVAGKYKAYYDGLLQGNTGRIDLQLKEVKQRLAEREQEMEQQTAMVQQLNCRLVEIQGDTKTSDEQAPSPPPGITLEEAGKLEDHIETLKSEVNTLQSTLSAAEDVKDKMTRQISSLKRQLEEEKSKFAQLQMDTEMYKKKIKMEQEKASKMAQNQLATMQKEMKEKMVAAERQAAEKAKEQAELERIRDQANFQKELEKRMDIESELRSKTQQQQQAPPVTIGDTELLASLERLQKTDEYQKKEIVRLQKDLNRSNRAWELKMAVMRKNFHALKDECFIRHSLQRQSAALHHATVGYAVSGDGHNPSSKDFRTLRPRLKTPKSVTPNMRRNGETVDLATAQSQLGTGSVLSIPPPSPNLPTQQHRPSESPTTAHDEEEEELMLYVDNNQETVEA